MDNLQITTWLPDAMRKAILRVLFINEASTINYSYLPRLSITEIIKHYHRYKTPKDIIEIIKKNPKFDSYHNVPNNLIKEMQFVAEACIKQLELENKIVQIEQSPDFTGAAKSNLVDLTSRTIGTKKERFEDFIKNTAVEFSDGNAVTSNIINDFINICRLMGYIWTTLDGTLIVEGVDIHGAIVIPQKISISDNGPVITEGIMIIILKTGYLEWSNFKNKSRTWGKGKINSLPRMWLTKDMDSNRGYFLTLGLSDKLLSEIIKPKNSINNNLLPKTNIAPVKVNVQYMVKNTALILKKLGSPSLDYIRFSRILSGSSHIIKPHVINVTVGKLLPKDAVSAMRRFPSCTVAVWNLVNTPCTETTIRRRQFIISHPGFFGLFLGKVNMDILNDIDTGISVFPRLNILTIMPVATLRHLAKIPWQRIIESKITKKYPLHDNIYIDRKLIEVWKHGFIYEEDIDFNSENSLINDLFSKMPIEWLPKDNMEWFGFWAAFSWLNGLNIMPLKAVLKDKSEKSKPLLSRQLIISLFIRLCKRHKGNWLNICNEVAHLDGVNEINDTFRWVISRLLYAMPDIEKCVQNNIGFLQKILLDDIDKVDVRYLSNSSQKWHRDGPSISAQFIRIRAIGNDTNVPDTNSWLPLTKEHKFVIGGGTVEWLLTSDALQTESNVMNHCVWSYSHSCMEENVHIAHVVGANGNKSTLALSIYETKINDDQKYAIKIMQHLKEYNKNPEEDCLEVATQLMKYLHDQPQERLEEQTTACKVRKEYFSKHKHSNKDFDSTNIEQCKEAYKIISRYLHPKWNLEYDAMKQLTMDKLY